MIRLAVPEDFTSLMSIYAYARSFMQETGNPNQWGNHFPPEELIHNRIRDKQHAGDICIFEYNCKQY